MGNWSQPSTQSDSGIQAHCDSLLCMLTSVWNSANYQQDSDISEVLENNYPGANLPTGLPEERDREGHQKNGKDLKKQGPVSHSL